jgi:hypothetical protein
VIVVVVDYAPYGVCDRGQSREEVHPVDGVQGDGGPLLPVERPRLEEYRPGHQILAKVVKVRA